MASGSRLPDLSREDLTPDQRDVLPYLESQINASFSVIKSRDPETNTLIGPFGIFLHSPALARSFFGVNETLARVSSHSVLLPRVREVAILVVGARFRAGYELYAHGLVAVSVSVGLDLDTVEQIKAGGGKCPVGLTDEAERVAWEVATALSGKMGPLRLELWERGNRLLGEEGMFCLVQYVGYYCWVCVVLNGFGGVVPE